MNKKIKILYFMDGIGNAGGIQEMVINWLKNFDLDKIQVDILSYDTGKKDNYKERFEAFGGKVYLIPTFTQKGRFKESIRATKDFFKRHRDYSILHAHASSKAYFVLKEAKRANIKVRILHSHCTQFVNRSKKSLLVGSILKPFANFYANKYFACSTEAGNFLFGKKRMKKKGVFIPNGIETSKFTFKKEVAELKRQELGLTNKIVIGNVGRFRPQKNHDFLVDVFNSIHKIEPRAILVLVGNGELLEQIEKKINNLDLCDCVKLLGYRSDVNEIMQTFDVMVMTSLFEGLPVTGVEAQSMGVPCLFSTNITKDVKIIPNVLFCGLKDSPDDWAKKALLLASEKKCSNSKDYLLDKKYEISLSAKYLQELYLSYLKRSE